MNELVNSGNGCAVIESGLNFGGGALQNFGLNSNTSANGFIKCLYKRKEIPNQPPPGPARSVAATAPPPPPQATSSVAASGSGGGGDSEMAIRPDQALA